MMKPKDLQTKNIDFRGSHVASGAKALIWGLHDFSLAVIRITFVMDSFWTINIFFLHRSIEGVTYGNICENQQL